MGRASILFFLGLLSLPLFGQPGADQQTDRSRPRIGLALSGGGAKGLAHIGVLKVMEELGIRPDFITGTSMGSIVGGLYAMGYSATELETIVGELDWDLILSDKTLLRNVVLEEKPYYANENLEVPIGKGFKVAFPEAIIQGQQLELELKTLTLPVYHINEFSELPIPFRCVAADIKNARKEILSRGDLATALRASMAIPAFFTPVFIDSMILVDGGVTNNFPVDEVIEMGADLIIGVNVNNQHPDEEYYLSPISQAFEAAMMMSNQQFDRQRDSCDVFFQIDLGKYGASDFSAADSIVAIGEAQARKGIQQFKDIIEEHKLDVRPGSGERTVPRINGIRIDSISISGNQTYTRKEIQGSLNLYENDVVNVARLDSSIQRLLGTGVYNKVGYTLSRENGKNVLDLQIKEKSPAFLKLALLFDNYHKAGLQLNLTRRNLFWSGSTFRALATVSDNYRFGLHYQQYLNREQNLFLDARAEFHRENLEFFISNLDLGQTPQLILPLDLKLAWRFTRNGLIHLGGRYENRRFSPNAGDLAFFERVIMNNAMGSLGFLVNTLDRAYLPRRGWTLDARLRVINNLNRRLTGVDSLLEAELDQAFLASPYPNIYGAARIYLPLGRQKQRFQLAIHPALLLNYAGNNAVVDYFFLGGSETLTEYSLPMAGFQVNSVGVNSAAVLGLDLRYFINTHFGLHLRNSGALVAFPSDPSSGEGLGDLQHVLAGLSLGAAYNSFLGPVSIDFNFPLVTPQQADNGFSIYLHYGYRF